MQDLAFNTFGFPMVSFVETAEMVLRGSTDKGQPERKDGIVVDLGHRGKRIDLVKDGKVDVVYSLTHVRKSRTNWFPPSKATLFQATESTSGHLLTLALKEAIWKKMDPKPKFIDLNDLPIIESIKEGKCYVSLDYEHACRSAKTFALPIQTGYHGVKLTTELFAVPEMYFRTSISPGTIQSGVVRFLQDHHLDVILCGGSSLFTG